MTRSDLHVGDRIRILRVPDGDAEQRERERAEGAPDAGFTADTIERILEQRPVVVIDRIDEYGFPWFDVELIAVDGRVEEHTLAIMDDDSWELA